MFSILIPSYNNLKYLKLCLESINKKCSSIMKISENLHGTTILSVRRGKKVALGGDGQVTLGNVVIKSTAKKVRTIYNGQILTGIAGATADAFTLFETLAFKP